MKFKRFVLRRGFLAAELKSSPPHCYAVDLLRLFCDAVALLFAGHALSSSPKNSRNVQ